LKKKGNNFKMKKIKSYKIGKYVLLGVWHWMKTIMMTMTATVTMTEKASWCHRERPVA
jgi:hypothetical protein